MMLEDKKTETSDGVKTLEHIALAALVIVGVVVAAKGLSKLYDSVFPEKDNYKSGEKDKGEYRK